VRTGTTPADRNFKIVDFGLSKSFVVPRDSSFADPKRPWGGRWMSPSFAGRAGGGSSGEGIAADDDDDATTTATMMTMATPSGGCVRLERDSAEFRGTSMYASLRVHQGKDHCPRDDVWGLLYVFCDLVSGGLPWMGYASARDRGSCQILKEMIMGERGRDDWAGDVETTTEGGGGGKRMEGMAGRPDPAKVPRDGSDAMEWLLFGAEYHTAKYRRDMKSQGSSEADLVDSLPALPEPLALSKNPHYVDCLRRAFRHVASLGFVELPDYDLVDECLRGFLRDVDPDDLVPSIDWRDRPASSRRLRRAVSAAPPAPPALDGGGVAWHPLDEDADPLDDGTLVEAEIDRRAALEAAAALVEDTSRSAKFDGGGGGASAASVLDPGASLAGEAADLARLPLQLQFRLSQVEYNARHSDTIPPHVALRDWMALAVPLAHGTWDTATWERGNHRTDDDGYRNEVYMSMLRKCLDAADPFNRFSDRDCYYHPLAEGETKAKRRRVTTSVVPQLVSDDSAGGADDDAVMESPLVVVSRVFFSLRLRLSSEQGKNFAPPPKLSFGFGRA
jgi:serine/threonine protein kinase